MSLRNGATAVYRQDERGEHYQIREYEEHWMVTFHAHNPHYEPLQHLLADVSVRRVLTGRLGRERPRPEEGAVCDLSTAIE